MTSSTAPLVDAATRLSLALLESSQAPLVLLADDLTVVGASASFCSAFGIDPASVNGTRLADIGKGEWNVPQLNSLLRATFEGAAAIEAYEMRLERDGHDTACLILNAHKLDYGKGEVNRIVLAVTDVTSARLAEKLKDELVLRNDILLRELQHRVANSLQIIASVLMQSARRVQSEETRLHLHDAHNRVMSIATLQSQLAVRNSDEVELRKYMRDLCASIGASMIDDPDRISIGTSIEDVAASANAAVSLGLIVTELVINALKHAFPGRLQQGHIEVDYLRSDGSWTLSVDDNGNGMGAEADARPGLGTGIVEALAKQLDAEVHTESSDRGTKVSIIHTD
ncbi:histidine kinase dimerization/phosphoacceptor domain -containing protein [Altererythrobacter sp. H2]|uniref:sensor histidine kinase n=1 Tax=Altererythrobacter sp. H2 TaxID=3108391 RepID=UPI002B4BDC90|nr:histidine kinase dimerization/phosphoacceptor domain -containing protein [Altererythrobacter sp. H2]WRK95863.1 histidine kinase dimerization/phosphoacceptor domain -containing protein [Altererythrobacter sp. H2]